MKKIIKLTESDLTRIIKRVIKEQSLSDLGKLPTKSTTIKSKTPKLDDLGKLPNKTTTPKPSGIEKPPYFKNLYGGTLNVTKDNKSEVEKTMSRILKMPVTLGFNDSNTSDDFRDLVNSEGKLVYMEYDRVGETYWERRKLTEKGDLYLWGVDGIAYYVDSFDSKWNYYKSADLNGGNAKYYVAKKDNSMVKSKVNLVEPQSSGDSYVELKPGTNAYNAVKTKVFGD